MLSDEEIVLIRLKETLNVLKGKNVIGRLDFQIRDMVEDCIRVIEKQSKEIEELKEKRFTLFDTTIKATIKINDKKWEDKIKAKIEEIENTGIDVAWEQVNYTIREQDRAKIQVLQSLLEKE